MSLTVETLLPGDPGIFARAALDLHGRADEADAARSVLRHMAEASDTTVWDGKTGEAFRHALGQRTAELDLLAGASRSSANAMSIYGSILGQLQRELAVVLAVGSMVPSIGGPSPLWPLHDPRVRTILDQRLAAENRLVVVLDESRRPMDLSDVLDAYQVGEDGMTVWEPWYLSPFMAARKITATEAAMLDRLGLADKYKMKNAQDSAYDVAEARYPDDDDPDPKVRGAKDGTRGNAFQHAYWNALMTRGLGADFARKFATAHEGRPDNPAAFEAMDLHNNEVGRRIAVDHPNASPDELADLVQQAGSRGELLIIGPDGALTPSG